MRSINLTHGAGNGKDSACLLTASNMLIGRGNEGNLNRCVCPSLADFINPTNEEMPEGILRKLYSPLVAEIIGTRNDDPDVIKLRNWAFRDWAVRKIFPMTLMVVENFEGAKLLQSLPKIIDAKTELEARNRFREVQEAYGAVDMSTDDAATDAASAITHLAFLYESENREEDAWSLCVEVIMQVASIGDNRPENRKSIKTVMTHNELMAALAS